MEVAIVVIECGRSFDGGEEDIRPAVAVDVTKGRSGADEEVAIGQRVCIVHVIAVRESGGSLAKLREAGVAATSDDEIAPAVAGFLVPWGVHGRGARASERENEQRGGATAGEAGGAAHHVQQGWCEVDGTRRAG